MGWNSWDAYGTTVTEADVKRNADYMATHLKRYGWQYIVIDIQWYEPNAKAQGYRPNAELVLDEFGRLLPAPNRFPSAANGQGFKPLADYIHARGLKFGIHIMRGIPRQAVRAAAPVFGSNAHAHEIADEQSICPWNTDMYGVRAATAGGQAYYDSIVKLYAAWGVDYIKADDMAAVNGQPPDAARRAEIAALHRAIAKVGRPIVLSLSPGPASTADAEFLRANAQLWRISDDFWDRWEDLKRQFELTRRWAPFVAANSFPDADMLPLGRIGLRAERGTDRRTHFTADEQFTLLTLWAMFRSPLMFGGDLPSNDEFTLLLLTNAEVLAVNQHSTNNRELFTRGNTVAWVADAPRGRAKYLAVFNLGDDAMATTVNVPLRELGFTSTCVVRDLWPQRELGNVRDEVIATVNRHGARLYRVSPVRR
ncbi:MAG: glycoside hydrolase family 27 protein [Pyrinomonadaceae bacterium]